jgi:hypothetical protein
VREVPGLLRRAILRYYADAPDRFCAHYDLPSGAYDRFADRADDVDSMVIRHDFVLTNNQLRLLELNIGSNLGGWQLDWLAPQTIELIRRHPACQQWRVSHTNTLEAFCRFIHRALHAHVGDRAAGVVVVLLNAALMKGGMHRTLGAVYDRILKETSSRGRMLFDIDFRSFSRGAGGRIEHEGRPVDCVLAGLLERTMPELSEAHYSHQVFYPDNVLARLLGNKTNFAILHAARSAGWLDRTDADLIAEYIPWSALLTDDVVEWGGRTAPVPELARARQADLVLKLGVSLQGRDVFVGRFLSEDEWAAAIARAGTAGDWLVQEYCPADRLYAPNREGVVTEHDPVWGIFGFGHEYGGAFVRIMESTITRGAINSARGAAESVILDV